MNADTEYPRSWHQLLPLLIFLIGALVTFLLWHDTRDVLTTESARSQSQLHEAQSRQLQSRIQETENSLSQLATSLATTALAPEAALQAQGLALLERHSAWRHLALARIDEQAASLEILASVPRTGTLWRPGQDLLEDPLWQPLVKPRPQQPGVRTTPRFTTADGQQLQAMVRPLRLADGQQHLLIVGFEPSVLIEQALALPDPIPLRTSIIDRDQHEHEPLFVNRDVDADGPVLETPVQLGDRGWLVRSQGLTDVFDGSASQLLSAMLGGGLALSLAAALAFWHLNRQRLEAQNRESQLRHRWDRDLKALENKRLEKQVLSRSLSDSEQRTRDFIQLGAGIGFELDDEQAIGYVSRQIQTLLGHAPSDLAGAPLADLFPPTEQQRLSDALAACRHQREPTQLDTRLLHSNGHTVAFRMHMCSITDALSHCQGYRTVAWPREDKD